MDAYDDMVVPATNGPFWKAPFSILYVVPVVPLLLLLTESSLPPPPQAIREADTKIHNAVFLNIFIKLPCSLFTIKTKW